VRARKPDRRRVVGQLTSDRLAGVLVGRHVMWVCTVDPPRQPWYRELDQSPRRPDADDLRSTLRMRCLPQNDDKAFVHSFPFPSQAFPKRHRLNCLGAPAFPSRKSHPRTTRPSITAVRNFHTLHGTLTPLYPRLHKKGHPQRLSSNSLSMDASRRNVSTAGGRAPEEVLFARRRNTEAWAGGTPAVGEHSTQCEEVFASSFPSGFRHRDSCEFLAPQ